MHLIHNSLKESEEFTSLFIKKHYCDQSQRLQKILFEILKQKF